MIGNGEYGVTGRELAVFELGGKDARDLVQRLTSNQVLVKPPAVIDNLFPDMNGRIVAPVQHWWLSVGDFMVVERSLAAKLAAWLEEMTFREHATFTLRDGIGVHTTVLASDFDATARAQENASESHRTVMLGDRFVRETLVFAPIPTPAQQVSAAEFRYFAFDHGSAMRVADVVVGRNPHEAQLSGWLSDQKGCYCGQEVIARLETYQKVQRRLRVYAVEGAVETATLSLGADVVADVVAQAALPGQPTLLAAYVKNAAVDAAALTLTDGRAATRVQGY